MLSSKQSLRIIESALLGPSPPSPSQRVELLHAIHNSMPAFRSLLQFPSPKASDRAQVQSKEVRRPDSSTITLDDQDVVITLKLSDDLHLNEIECVHLLVAAHQEWALMGRDPSEIFHLAAGLWYTERRDLIMSLYTLLRAVVLDQGLEAGLVSDIQRHLEDLINSGLRQRLISLIKELNREEPAGLGGPSCERYILDSRGALVERRAVVCRERLILGHCLVLSILVVRIGPKDVRDLFSVLKDCAAELNETKTPIKLQIVFSLLFSIIIAFVSDALSAVPNKASILSSDASFRNEFQDTVMVSGNNPTVEGFVDAVRFAWTVHLLLIHDMVDAREAVPSASPKDLDHLQSCLEVIFSHNAFQFMLQEVIQTAAYQNDDEDMTYMYNAYLHKLVSCFLSHPLARDKVKESKDRAMNTLSQFRATGSQDFMHDGDSSSHQASETLPSPFVSLLNFVSEIYRKEPELLSSNDVLWTFANFAGEDHTNFQTLVAFLNMLSTLACNEEGASRVFELLQGKAFRSVGWTTLFDCLSIYDEKFRQSLQTAGALLPEFQEGDAKALVAYLNVLQKVVENGNPVERKNWFPDIEPLFKLLSYENVPPYLKGALRNAIASFIQVSSDLKDIIWCYLEQYDLPVLVASHIQNGTKSITSQVYDMQFEVNEIEARQERYPSTISFLNLLNALIAKESDLSDRGRRFVGIFRFIYDHVFGPFPQRAYADAAEKWQLVVACLQHFNMILKMYDINEEDVDVVIDRSQSSMDTQSSSLQTQLPVLELLKDFMSGKSVFRNIMGILLPGVNSLITERTSQIYGQLLEKSVELSLEIMILVLEKDLLLADYWRPLYQPLEVILSQDHSQIVALLEYVRYDFHPKIQQLSIKIMSILSSRMVGLVQLLLKSNTASSLVEDYASCLELRSEECHVIENSGDDPGVLIMQLLIDNISRPAPNVTHLLLKFNLETSIERTILQPKFHYSCLKVVLEILEKLSNPEVNALLFEFGFQLLYELCLDPLTSGPVMDLLSNKKYYFFVKHLDTIGVVPLPKRNNHTLRVSSLHQRAWLLKLLAIELHAADLSSPIHREACQSILAHLYGQEIDVGSVPVFSLQHHVVDPGTRTMSKSKALELLEVVQFRTPDTSIKLPQIVSNLKYELLTKDILGNPSTSQKGGIYHYSERGDRLIDLTSFCDKLWQKFNADNPQLNNVGREAELEEVKETIQQFLRWGWKYNKNLEEQAAQLHMLTSWSQTIEVTVSRRISSLENRSDILFQVLDASLSASASPDCSLKMAYLLCQVALTCMAKLRDERYSSPGGLNADSVSCLDIIMVKQISNGACHSILLKLIMAILRNESSEALRRRQYALLLSYLQYCQNMLDPDVPTTILQVLLQNEQDGEDVDLQKIDKDQAELAHANFSILRKEAQSILNVVIKDATQGSEPGKTISLYVLDALICIDHDRFFLNQLQNRGFLKSCLVSISNVSLQDGVHSFDSLQRACTLEAELALLSRISHKYGKFGAQLLFSTGALEHLDSCRAINLQGNLRWVDMKPHRDVAGNFNKQQAIVTPILRLLFSMTSLVDTSEFFEVKNKIVREAIDFIKRHQRVFDQILGEDVSEADDSTLEQINLLVASLSKVWPYEETDEYGFVQSLFQLMHSLFSRELDSRTPGPAVKLLKNRRSSELHSIQLNFSLISYLYFLVTRKSLRLQVSGTSSSHNSPVRSQRPSLDLLGTLLNSTTITLEKAAEERLLLLNKIRDINELSRQEVEEIIVLCLGEDFASLSDNIQRRRYIAMIEMCKIVGNKSEMITLLLPLAEYVLNVMLIHFQDSVIPDGNANIKAIAYHGELESGHEISSLCGKLIPVLERLELLSENKIGENLKVFGRLVSSVKEVAIQKLDV
ncbi:nuclear pore complex protein NUP205 isoform X2 [Cucurbita moschata]|uniref:Nuclear pore complex protein NUP205 isoform X2 n=1 Tax=Cucurbita moschata TaxID=3662 RepID=A0A6J1FDF5_CUCMO|nr:nuclear pore complex protein NUP205 isoform X2 [Cucurbita moschata]